ncbi:hypothetical protein SUGI_0591760 [Cryptomeria japonica]|nr:hypothetical protein SUGI_0591760 [Cryptomeria japonica]
MQGESSSCEAWRVIPEWGLEGRAHDRHLVANGATLTHRSNSSACPIGSSPSTLVGDGSFNADVGDVVVVSGMDVREVAKPLGSMSVGERKCYARPSFSSVVARVSGLGPIATTYGVLLGSLIGGGDRGFIHVSYAIFVNLRKETKLDIEHNENVFAAHNVIC